METTVVFVAQMTRFGTQREGTHDSKKLQSTDESY